jgi:hypothetical protein
MKMGIFTNFLRKILGVLHVSNENMFPRPLKESETAEYFEILYKWKQVESGELVLSKTETDKLLLEKIYF